MFCNVCHSILIFWDLEKSTCIQLSWTKGQRQTADMAKKFWSSDVLEDEV